ncbi:hypothetical protein PG999_004507 [Apiospora kogelbergensis]|uniref:Uncharacterized protein n=1 Tax=Apiospora kogelbergensis TaxID=1337665 RepID=A0AAW0QZF1_9PEZI
MAFHSKGGGVPTPFPTFHHDSEDLPFPQPLGSATRAQSGGPENPASSFSQMEANGNPFDLLEWYPHFQSCAKYFLEHAQHSPPVQAANSPMHMQSPNQTPAVLTLNPYIRRLVATGFDFPAVLHGFFGDSWALGIGPMHEVERRNYLFAAKSASWLDVKSHYGMGEEQIPFLRPLQNVTEKEIVSAESNWSEWLAMQDWMVGPRSLGVDRHFPTEHIKTAWAAPQ